MYKCKIQLRNLHFKSRRGREVKNKELLSFADLFILRCIIYDHPLAMFLIYLAAAAAAEAAAA